LSSLDCNLRAFLNQPSLLNLAIANFMRRCLLLTPRTIPEACLAEAIRKSKDKNVGTWLVKDLLNSFGIFSYSHNKSTYNCVTRLYSSTISDHC
jgi:hypothetical protein